MLLDMGANAKNSNSIPQETGLAKVMGDQNNCFMKVPLQLGHHFLQPMPNDGIYRSKRLVHQ